MSWTWMMAYGEDDMALAAEYALGTLDSEERKQVEAMMSADKQFTEVVRSWEYRLGALNQMVGSVEPRPEVWDNIKAGLRKSQEQALPLLSDPEPLPTAPVLSEPAVTPEPDEGNVLRLTGAVRRWRNIATFTGAIAAALVAIIAVGVYRPDLLPGLPRAKPATELAEPKTTPAPAPGPALPAAQYVAVLQSQSETPAFILTIDGATKNLTVRMVNAQSEPGKSFELWLISDKLPRPRSLGVIGATDFTSRPVLASYDSEVVNTATYAVTVEEAGGSPDGNPHSAAVFTGKLIETVPAAPMSPRG